MVYNFNSYINEEVKDIDYSTYSRSLDYSECKNILRTECSDSDIKTIQLSRQLIGKNLPKILLVDASKHEIRYSYEGRYHNYIWLMIMDNSKIWRDIPNRYRSIDFWYTRYPKSLDIATDYILVPFNGAKLAKSPKMMGLYMKYVNDKFQIGPAPLCANIRAKYKEIFKEDIDFTDTESVLKCLRRLNEPILEDNVMPKFRTEMIKNNKTDFVDYLDFLFGPKKNDIKLEQLSNCYESKNDCGWTDSKVLMISKDILTNRWL